jgi:hypothetical protein
MAADAVWPVKEGWFVRMSVAVVKSRQSVESVVLNLLSIVGGGVAFPYGGVLYLASGAGPTFMGILMLLTGLVLLYAGLTGISTSLVVSLEGIRVRSLWGSREVSWREVQTLHFQTNYFNKYSARIVLDDPDKRPVGLLLGLLGNSHELGKALVEAAYTSNPEIRFSGAHHYGPPPYGIFSGQSEYSSR